MSKRKRKKRRIIFGIFTITFLGVVMLFFVLRFRTIKVTGNDQYSGEEIQKLIYEKDYDRSLGKYLIDKLLNKKKKIPFIQSYEVEMVTLNEVKITVYEKNIIACLNYMGSYMYFDRDGVVVESTEEAIEGVPEILGLNYDYAVLHEKLPVEEKGAFEKILEITQIIKKYEKENDKIKVDKLYLSKNLEITFMCGDVKVELGNDKHINEKMDQFAGISRELGTLKGTLNMREYDVKGKYILKED